MWTSSGFKDYELIDCGGLRRLERWDKYILVRPDPQAIWKEEGHKLWDSPHGIYHRSSSGGGRWEIKSLPESWSIGYKNLRFNIKPMSFKHTGVFPEQAANWDFIGEKLKGRKNPSVLNLFAYTGGASLAAAAAGASVCHVDAARGMVSWARENAKSSGLEGAPIRYIVDDCIKFIRREANRGRRYDAIIMDPPSYGRGPSGEVWRMEENLKDLLELCLPLLSGDPIFFIVNSYTAGLSPSVPAYMLGNLVARRFGGAVQAGELGIKVTSTGLMLPCGHTSRWESGR